MKATIALTLLLVAAPAIPVGYASQSQGAQQADTPPVEIFCPVPSYSEDARKYKISGTVVLQILARSDGSVDPMKIVVVRALGYGLEEKAVEAARECRFKPATHDGKPVDFTTRVEFGFHEYPPPTFKEPGMAP